MKPSNEIKIVVNTRYLREQSEPAAQRFAFAYTIEITNCGEQTVTLLNRHWRITDDNNRVEEVRGDGVIGQQPVIHPGQSFHYTSGTVIGTEFGTMDGSYEMLGADGKRFKANIPPFLLSLPHTVH